MSSLVSIAEKKKKRISSYSIAKEWNVSLATIFRNIDRIKSGAVFLIEICSEVTRIICSDFDSLSTIAQKLFAWPVLTRRWYHTFYPTRVQHILNPHNLATKPP
jgi:hypothetical protein